MLAPAIASLIFTLAGTGTFGAVSERAPAGIAFTTLRAGAIEGDGVVSCRRIRARRVDCAMASAGRRCEVTAAISFAGGRVRWGTYGCPFASHPRYRRRPRPVRPGDWSCEEIGASCPAPLFGKLSAAAILPANSPLPAGARYGTMPRACPSGHGRLSGPSSPVESRWARPRPPAPPCSRCSTRPTR